jgi:hypothetical protein
LNHTISPTEAGAATLIVIGWPHRGLIRQKITYSPENS